MLVLLLANHAFHALAPADFNQVSIVRRAGVVGGTLLGGGILLAAILAGKSQGSGLFPVAMTVRRCFSSGCWDRNWLGSCPPDSPSPHSGPLADSRRRDGMDSARRQRRRLLARPATNRRGHDRRPDRTVHGTLARLCFHSDYLDRASAKRLVHRGGWIDLPALSQFAIGSRIEHFPQNNATHFCVRMGKLRCCHIIDENHG